MQATSQGKNKINPRKCQKRRTKTRPIWSSVRDLSHIAIKSQTDPAPQYSIAIYSTKDGVCTRLSSKCSFRVRTHIDWSFLNDPLYATTFLRGKIWRGAWEIFTSLNFERANYTHAQCLRILISLIRSAASSVPSRSSTLTATIIPSRLSRALNTEPYDLCKNKTMGPNGKQLIVWNEKVVFLYPSPNLAKIWKISSGSRDENSSQESIACKARCLHLPISPHDYCQYMQSQKAMVDFRASRRGLK